MQIGSIHTLQAIAQFLGREFIGDPKLIISGINTFLSAHKGDLTWLNEENQKEKDAFSDNFVFITNSEKSSLSCTNCILSPEPFLDFKRLLLHFSPPVFHKKMSGDRCDIAESAHLSPNCFIGNDVIIGEKVIIHPGAYIGDGTILEDEVEIGPNSVIGASSSELFVVNGAKIRLHTCGNVLVEKGTRIGASCTIEAGTTAQTHIGADSYIGNCVYIQHDARIEKNSHMNSTSQIYSHD